MSRIIFDLCGFSGAGPKITFGLRVMDSMTQFGCQKVRFSRLFCVILCHIFGPSKCDWQRANSAIVRLLVAHYFSVQTKKNAAFGSPGIYICYVIYIYINMLFIYIYYILQLLYFPLGKYNKHIKSPTKQHQVNSNPLSPIDIPINIPTHRHHSTCFLRRNTAWARRRSAWGQPGCPPAAAWSCPGSAQGCRGARRHGAWGISSALGVGHGKISGNMGKLIHLDRDC